MPETAEKPNLVDAITPDPEPEDLNAAPEAAEPAPEPPKKKRKTKADTPPEDVINVLEDRTEPVEVKLTYGGSEGIYFQQPLTYFRKMEFFGLLGETLDTAISGEDGLSVNSVFGADDNLMNAFGDLDSFMALAAKIAHYVPSFLKDAYLVILNVPKHERIWAREALDELDDEAGLAIADRFIDQNWESIRSFFIERLPALMEKVQAKPKD